MGKSEKSYWYRTGESFFKAGLHSRKSFLSARKKGGFSRALFELCFVLGWVLGGGSSTRLQEVKVLAQPFGRAFQLIDDYDQDLTAKKENNYAVLYGIKKAEATAKAYIESFKQGLSNLQLESSNLMGLAQAMEKAL